MRTLETQPDETVDLPHSGTDPAEIRKELEQILQSKPFRTSRQCRDLLHYIVEHSLDGHASDLRERIVGIEVFGRSPDYDTAEDPVVRMRAADVRKRLAQFYQAEKPGPLHIELKPGAYRANFRIAALPQLEVPGAAVSEPTDALQVQPPEQKIEQLAVSQNTLRIEPTRRARAVVARWVGAVIVIVALCFLTLALRFWTNRTTAQSRFWAPVLQRHEPVLIYTGTNVAYRFTPGYLEHYRQEHGLDRQNGPEFFPNLPKGAAIRSDDLVAVENTFITTGDLAASVQVASLLKGWTQQFVLRSGSDLSMSELRNAPAVFIGGFNNHWTLATTDPLPLSFRDGTSIVDRANPAQRWTIGADNHGEPTEDFALISRVLHSSTGGPALVISGIGSYGTQAAAEFISSPEKMNELLRSAPPGWEDKNMQAVLRINVVGYTPMKVEVAKTCFW